MAEILAKTIRVFREGNIQRRIGDFRFLEVHAPSSGDRVLADLGGEDSSAG
jgi:hypothetical protein